MPDDGPDLSQPAEVRRYIGETVGAQVEAKLRYYRRILYAFLGGLGLIVAVLVGTGLVSERSLIEIVHDQIFGFERSLDDALSGSVAVSYNNQFWLGTAPGDDQVQSITFYADTTQEVEALVDISHVGTGRPLEVTITLDEAPASIWSKATDLHERLDITKAMRGHDHLIARDVNVHRLTFGVQEGAPTEDRVFVSALVNVRGRDRARR